MQARFSPKESELHMPRAKLRVAASRQVSLLAVSIQTAWPLITLVKRLSSKREGVALCIGSVNMADSFAGELAKSCSMRRHLVAP